MARTELGLSREFIIHPGETLAEVLEELGMSQQELATRTGFTPKHISKVINGMAPISAKFAKKLEYALGVKSSFWMNLQSNYDQELQEFEELNGITQEEIKLVKQHSEIVDYFIGIGALKNKDNYSAMVIDIRALLGFSNLEMIGLLPHYGAFRARINNNSKIDIFSIACWEKVCELATKDIELPNELNRKLLEQNIDIIKSYMGLDPNIIRDKLQTILAQCGIAFEIVHNFKGAPVQGFIKAVGERITLCVTLRQHYADVFWFTFFHEIAHILNNDYKKEFIDFESIDSDMEKRADELAKNLLIDPQCYSEFLAKKDFSDSSINRFAASQNIESFIVYGRLMKEEVIPWNRNNGIRPTYDWV